MQTFVMTIDYTAATFPISNSKLLFLIDMSVCYTYANNIHRVTHSQNTIDCGLEKWKSISCQNELLFALLSASPSLFRLCLCGEQSVSSAFSTFLENFQSFGIRIYCPLISIVILSFLHTFYVFSSFVFFINSQLFWSFSNFFLLFCWKNYPFLCELGEQHFLLSASHYVTLH